MRGGSSQRRVKKGGREEREGRKDKTGVRGQRQLEGLVRK